MVKLYSLSKFTELVFSCLFFIFISNKMAYTSREEWDTNINSVGGKKDIHLVVSPWSQDQTHIYHSSNTNTMSLIYILHHYCVQHIQILH